MSYTPTERTYAVSVLLPTRGRTTALETSVFSLVDQAQSTKSFEILLAFDRDDTASIDYFNQTVVPALNKKSVAFQAFAFDPVGYANLNKYLNLLSSKAAGSWLMFWNDDAIMETAGWDQQIAAQTGNFSLLAVHTHRDHPYSIFPIIPWDWYQLTGTFSRHQMADAELSQIAYLLDRFCRIDVRVSHDRFDLTGNNNDNTYQRRILLEGNSDNPRDFNHDSYRSARFRDAKKIAWFLGCTGQQLEHWNMVLTGKADPWCKLIENDINKQVQRTK